MQSAVMIEAELATAHVIGICEPALKYCSGENIDLLFGDEWNKNGAQSNLTVAHVNTNRSE